MQYFEARRVGSLFYQTHQLPKHLKCIVQELRDNSKILDFGCGFGQNILSIKKYTEEIDKKIDIQGMDICQEAIDFCQSNGLKVDRMDDIFSYNISEEENKFDLVIMTHVLEHFPKNQIISLLKHIKDNILKMGGGVYLAVPNAQSNTGCYWAYEDFTHETLFTTGSLSYVLKMSGFSKIEFLDIDGVENTQGIKKIVKKAFLWLYKTKIRFWNKITSSSFHKPSLECFCYEIKVIATFKHQEKN